ncbi:MAG: hypothetical protein U5K71_08920 [Gracilimonas sp.]|nr:hypothetical protein [Gracilimonas sp.]
MELLFLDLLYFTIPVGPGGSEVSSTVEIGDDTSPPTIPVVSHEYESDTNNFWTPDPTELKFTFKSSDPESDVSLYKYKIGTTPGGAELRDWTNAQGARGTGMEQTGYRFLRVFLYAYF